MSKKIVIVGAGIVGMTIASKLSEDGHDVVVIEKDSNVTREIMDELDVHVVCGNGCSLEILREVHLDQADLLLAVTDSDEVNMITALIAGSSFNVDTKIVRLRSSELLESLPELSKNWPGRTEGISPDRVAAERILSLLQVPHAVDVAKLLGGKVVVAGFRITPRNFLIGIPMAELPKKFPGVRFLIAAIYRDGDALLPSGETALQAGDVAYCATEPKRVPQLVTTMGYSLEREHRAIIGGGGHIGRMIAESAIKSGIKTVIVRRNRAEAERLAIELPKATVLHGDVTSREMLIEAGIEDGATFIASTNDEEANLVASAVARQAGAQRVTTLVDNPNYLTLAHAMGVDSVASPRLATVSAVLRHVRGSHVEEVASLPQELVEISVVEVDKGSPLGGLPVGELGLPDGVLIAAVASAERVFVPGGRDTLPFGSRAVLFALAKQAEKLVNFLDRHD